MKDAIVMIGGGGHARSILAAVATQKMQFAGYVALQPDEATSLPYLGNDTVLEDLFAKGVRQAIIGVGSVRSNSVRREIYQRLRSIGFQLPKIVADSAKVAADAVLGEGVVVLEKALVNSGAKIGPCCIINSGAIVEHDCTFGEFVHISPGAVLCGGVKVGSNVHVGANATIIENIAVIDGALIGAGAAVVRDIIVAGKYWGVPARLQEK
jgi:sugar O-acyltransferase (sialic acid O-acetyltransferase NeuD family)